MSGRVVYNENDPYTAQWLRNLVSAGHIAEGEVVERDIQEVRADDVKEAVEFHAFAGIGGWSYALRLAGWPDDIGVWTGSCPCQPFSVAGRKGGFRDERHLWPEWFRLIKACKPPFIFGEQVCSSAVLGHQGEGSRIPDEISEAEPRARSCSSRAVPRAQEGSRLRPYEPYFGATGENRRWGMRDKRPAIQLGWWQDVGQPIDRQDRPHERIHTEQCTGRLPRGEQRDGRLGRSANVTDSPRDHEQAAGSLKRAIGAARDELAKAIGGEWFGTVCADLESAGYLVGATVLAAASIGAPHIRQRLFFVAHSQHAEWREKHGPGEDGCDRQDRGREEACGQPRARREVRAVGDAALNGERAHNRQPGESDVKPFKAGGPGFSVWSDVEWLECTDGKARPTQPGLFPLASGLPRAMGSMQPALRQLAELDGLGNKSLARAKRNRVGRLTGYGNAIVVPLAQAFIEAVQEVIDGI